MKKLFLLTLLTLAISFSCQEQETGLEANEVELSTFLDNYLNSIGNDLRTKGATFQDKDLVRSLGDEFLFSTDLVVYNEVISTYKSAFDISLPNARARTSNDVLTLSYKANEFLFLIDSELDESENLMSFNEKLNDIELEILGSNLSEQEKAFLSVQIITLKTSLNFVATNFDLFDSEEYSINERRNRPRPAYQQLVEDDLWWNVWGKCAASIAGGAITTGTTGLLGGAAVGTITLPVIGTVSGAAVGAIGGAIGGGLAGAAAGC